MLSNLKKTRGTAMKSKSTAYILLIILGWAGGHRFYLEKIGTGILYLFTFSFFGIGWIIDLFTLGNQVDVYNARRGVAAPIQNNQQNVVVNVTAPAHPGVAVAQVQVSAEKQILALADGNPVLSIKQIVSQTSLEIEQAEEALKKLTVKGMAKELVDAEGKVKYDFS